MISVSDSVDIEITICSLHNGETNSNNINNAVSDLFDENSVFVKSYEDELRFAQKFYDEEQEVRVYGIDFESSKSIEFIEKFAQKHENVKIIFESSNIDENYWSQSVFEGGICIYDAQNEFSEEYPDIYREHLENFMADA